MPGSALPPPPPPPLSSSLRPQALTAIASAATSPSHHAIRVLLTICSPLPCQDDVFSPAPARPASDLAHEAHDAARQQVHEQDQDAAVDHARERLVDVGGV